MISENRRNVSFWAINGVGFYRIWKLVMSLPGYTSPVVGTKIAAAGSIQPKTQLAAGFLEFGNAGLCPVAEIAGLFNNYDSMAAMSNLTGLDYSGTPALSRFPKTLSTHV